ncbi:MAG: GNAT N-acetyltransferase [Elusimicrobia bacterium]|nr:GNAT N-acetyltransferase [Elusimicrobiota bacterium]
MNQGIRLQEYNSAFDRSTVRWLNYPSVRRGFGLTYRISLSSHRQWRRGQKNLLFWGILDEKGRHQGNVLVHCNPRHRSGYLQMYIGSPRKRGKGLGQGALVAALDDLFFRRGFHRVWLHTLCRNSRVEKFYRRLGFSSEGVERGSFFRAGRFEDQRRWSILASEWRKNPGRTIQ